MTPIVRARPLTARHIHHRFPVHCRRILVTGHSSQHILVIDGNRHYNMHGCADACMVYAGRMVGSSLGRNGCHQLTPLPLVGLDRAATRRNDDEKRRVFTEAVRETEACAPTFFAQKRSLPFPPVPVSLMVDSKVFIFETKPSASKRSLDRGSVLRQYRVN